jgi:tryptophan 2,3-dioxygenase
MDVQNDLLERLQQLEEKYTHTGQHSKAYLEGLLYNDYVKYWDYIHLDALLGLQIPRTPIPDERIFILYHQITELYFRLMLDAMEQLGRSAPSAALFMRQLERLNRYASHLVSSFDIMVDGMDRDEFLRFRMSLLPASGFQSVQYRLIELASTDTLNLIHTDYRHTLNTDAPIGERCKYLYWRSGATELGTGKKTLTLEQFEEKYADHILRYAEARKHTNLLALYRRLPETDQHNPELTEAMRQYDLNVNVRWALSHYRSAVRYLETKSHHIEATGGTNWQQYLPPRFQRVIFFPNLWSAEEQQQWGRFQ